MHEWLKEILRSERIQFSFSGANNVGGVVELPNRKNAFVKFYGKNEDWQIRMIRELFFSKSVNYRIPKVYFYCFDAKIIIFEYIRDDGPLHEKKSRYLFDFIDYLSSVNTFGCYPRAAESAFFLSDFQSINDKRLLELTQSDSKEVKDFLNKNKNILIGNDIKNSFCGKAIISPSDLGFHNAIYRNDKLFFHDFEYAGVDSSWKLIADTLCQPSFDLSWEHVDLDLVLPSFEEDIGSFISALDMTYNKWVFIILKQALKFKKEEGLYVQRAKDYINQKEYKIENMKLRLKDYESGSFI